MEKSSSPDLDTLDPVVEPGNPNWKPDALQKERARSLPRESDELPIYGGHSITSIAMGLGYHLSHLVLPVSDLGRSEAWYRDVVGLEVLARNSTAEEKPHAVLRMNTGQLLILVESDSFQTKRPGTTGVHHAFLLTPNQYRRAMKRLEAMGHYVLDIRAQFRAQGEYSVNLKDPDGHRIQLQSHGPEAREIILPGTGVVDCGPASDYEVGDVNLFKEGDFFLVRLQEGFLALRRWCTHMNGKIVYQREHWRFRCPYHGATYDRRGDVLGGQPNLCALSLNPITFSVEGHVLVDTDGVIERVACEPGQAVSPVLTGREGARENLREEKP